MGAELLDSSDQIAAEIFRNDSEHSVGERIFVAQIPGHVLTWFRNAARRNLGASYEDGTPIDWSQLDA